MNRDEVINIIEEEKLENYNLNEERQNNENASSMRMAVGRYMRLMKELLVQRRNMIVKKRHLIISSNDFEHKRY